MDICLLFMLHSVFMAFALLRIYSIKKKVEKIRKGILDNQQGPSTGNYSLYFGIIYKGNESEQQKIDIYVCISESLRQ